MIHSMKVTKKYLKTLIAEECISYYGNLSKDHIEGQPWSGSIEDLAHAQANTWGHGSISNKVQWEDQIKKSRNLSVGKDKLSLKLTENELRKIVRTVLGECKKT